MTYSRSIALSQRADSLTPAPCMDVSRKSIARCYKPDSIYCVTLRWNVL
ncbi:hypothetical protein QUA54_03515 [Microcoleus sp. MOSTC5]